MLITIRNKPVVGNHLLTAAIGTKPRHWPGNLFAIFRTTGRSSVLRLHAPDLLKNYYPDLFKKGQAGFEDYQRLNRNLFELTDYLVNHLQFTDFGAEFPHKVCYHDACTALREYGIRQEPRLLLSKVKGLELVEMEDTETCCGFGGTFSTKFTAISTAMTEQKVENALKTGAEYIVSTESSCIMNIEGYILKNKLPIKPIHIADILASGWASTGSATAE